MNVTSEIAEARAHALGLREAATACGPAQAALKVRLVMAAESLQTLSLLATRALDRIEELKLELACDKATCRFGIVRECEAACGLDVADQFDALKGGAV